MNHFYQRIDGWFDFQDVYRDAVKQASSPAVFVEVGSYKGKSAAFMAVEIINSGKDITLFCVDCWEDETVYKEFLRNIETVKDRIVVIRDYSTSVQIMSDFTFIDASHNYEDVKADIEHWKPLSKRIAGHDFSVNWPGVQRAVKESFSKYQKVGNSWIGILP